VPRPKPAPDMLLLACKALQIPAANSVFVGDSIFDQQAARSAHIPFIGFGIPGDFMIRRLPELGTLLGVAWEA
jgi:phosphoglycolate phosphatase-like HAD superfamily hydrolase